jgi:hypothetical protein
MSLSLPTLLADGSTLMVDHDFITRLHEGDASIGWLGDERLGVYCTPGGIEIRRLCEDNELRVIMRSKPDVRVLNTDTLRFLAAHDGRGAGAGIADRIIAQNDKVRADAAKAFKEHCDDTADRLEFALMKDIGATEGSGLRHRLYKLSNNPLAKDVV